MWKNNSKKAPIGVFLGWILFLTIFVWSFVSAAIYKATKSVLACAIYHAFIDSIGAIYDWNALFDAYPKTNAMLLYFGIVFVAAVIIWNIYDRREMRR